MSRSKFWPESHKLSSFIHRRRYLGVAFFVLALFFWRLGVESQKIKSFEITSWTHSHRADCAVVLTGGPHRVREGLDMLSRGAVKKVIIAGVHPDAKFREIFPIWPYYPEVRQRDVVLERNSLTTFGNAQQAWPLVEALNCRDVVLVTSQVHMYRALQTFRAVLPSEFSIFPRTTPGRSAHLDRFEVWSESLKSLFYSVWAYRGSPFIAFY